MIDIEVLTVYSARLSFPLKARFRATGSTEAMRSDAKTGHFGGKGLFRFKHARVLASKRTFSGDREYKSYAIGRYADIVNDFLIREHDQFQEMLAKVTPEEVRASDLKGSRHSSIQHCPLAIPIVT
jgi:hypothetical protein